MSREEGTGSWNYPATSLTLLRKLREAPAGVDEAAWIRFVDLYRPVAGRLVRMLSPGIPDADAEDVVQDLFVRLVGVLRSGAYDPAKAKFRTYLSTMARRMLVDRYRSAEARRARMQVGLDAASDVPVLDDPATWVDAKWRLACRQAAEERVLGQAALSERSRETWRLLSDEGLTVKEAALRLGAPPNTVSKTKRRIEAMIEAAEALYAADGP